MRHWQSPLPVEMSRVMLDSDKVEEKKRMSLELFQTRRGHIDSRIEELVAKRLRGEWGSTDQMELDRLVSRRGSKMLPSRRKLKRAS